MRRRGCPGLRTFEKSREGGLHNQSNILEKVFLFGMTKRLEMGQLEGKKKERSYRARKGLGFILLILEIISSRSLSGSSVPGTLPGIEYFLHKHQKMDEGRRKKDSGEVV